MSETGMTMLERVRATLGSLEAALLGLERRLGRWGAACLVALALMLLGALYARPALEPISHGVYYAQLSESPFAPGENPVAQRILTPLLAWLLGMRGNGILVLNLMLAWVTLALVYHYYRAHGRGPGLALSYAAVLATSMPTLFTIYINGYTDAATYLLLVLLLLYGRNAISFGVLLLLALLNRESILFMLPFLLLLQKKRGTLAWSAVAVLVVGVLYALARWLLGMNATGEQSVAYYLTPLLRDPFHWLRMSSVAYYQGVFSAFKLLWLLPLAGLWACVARRRWLDAALIAGAVLCALAQTIIAVDTSRMLCMALPAVLLGLEALEEPVVRLRLESALLGLVGINLCVPQVYVAGNAVYVVQTLVGYLLTH